MVGGGTLGVIAGSALRESEFAHAGTVVDHAGVAVTEVGFPGGGNAAILQRHGLSEWSPPHRIDHAANFRALLGAGVDRVLAISSVGSLRLDWPVGTFVVVDDFYAPNETIAFHDDPQSHVVPGFDPTWSERVRDAWHDATDTRLVDGGTYAQTRGPRFETRAEVRALTHVADLVGMTVAAECIVATEVRLPYAAVCVVDNLANGLGTAPLTIDEFNAGVAANRARLIADLDAVLPTLASAP
jgi:5'-methylthioinosine phosphorylase